MRASNLRRLAQHNKPEPEYTNFIPDNFPSSRRERDGSYPSTIQVNFLPVWLRNWLISAGLEPVLIHTEKLCIASYYIKFSTNIKMYNNKIKAFF